MKAKNILEFLLHGQISIEQCCYIHTCVGETFSEYFFELCDDVECEEGDFFAFWSPLDEYDNDREELGKYGNSPDYELPTSDGCWAVVKIDD